VAGEAGGVHQIVVVKGDLTDYTVRQLPALSGLLKKMHLAALQGGSKKSLCRNRPFVRFSTPGD
jgi:hypothetical protein